MRLIRDVTDGTAREASPSSNLDSGGNSEDAVDVEVVVGSDEQLTIGSADLDKGGHGIDVAVREHVHLGECVWRNKHNITNGELGHGLGGSVLQRTIMMMRDG